MENQNEAQQLAPRNNAQVEQDVELALANFFHEGDLVYEVVGDEDFAIDNKMVSLVLHGFFAMYGLLNGKLAHLHNGDPFKERVNIYCYFTASYYIRLLVSVIPTLLPVAVRNEPPPQQRRRGLTKRFKTGVMTLVKQGARKTQGNRRQPQLQPQVDNAPRFRDQRAAIGVRFPLLRDLSLQFNVFTQTGVRQDEVEKANRQKRVFYNYLTASTETIEHERERSVAQVKFVFESLRNLQQKAKQSVTAYYGTALGCDVQVEQRVDEMFHGLREADDQNRRVIDVTPLVVLNFRMLYALQAFELAMHNTPSYELQRSEDGDVYAGRMKEFLALGHLDPFREVRLVQRDLQTTDDQLIALGQQLLA